MLRNAKELELFELHGKDGPLGRATDFWFDDHEWTVRYLVLDAGSPDERREVLVSPKAISDVSWESRELRLNLTRTQVSDSPPVDLRQPVSREHEAALAQHCSWPTYWTGAGFPDVAFGVPTLTPYSVPALAPVASPAQPAATQDQHLRSMQAVRGHAIEATDGRVGHVDDFLVDDRTWEVRYLIVDTRNWWPGKHVIVAPQWIREVGWDDAVVRVDLARDAIKRSPAYDPRQPVTPDYAGQLHEHYGRKRPPGC